MEARDERLVGCLHPESYIRKSAFQQQVPFTPLIPRDPRFNELSAHKPELKNLITPNNVLIGALDVPEGKCEMN